MGVSMTMPNKQKNKYQLRNYATPLNKIPPPQPKFYRQRKPLTSSQPSSQHQTERRISQRRDKIVMKLNRKTQAFFQLPSQIPSLELIDSMQHEQNRQISMVSMVLNEPPNHKNDPHISYEISSHSLAGSSQTSGVEFDSEWDKQQAIEESVMSNMLELQELSRWDVQNGKEKGSGSWTGRKNSSDRGLSSIIYKMNINDDDECNQQGRNNGLVQFSESSVNGDNPQGFTSSLEEVWKNRIPESSQLTHYFQYQNSQKDHMNQVSFTEQIDSPSLTQSIKYDKDSFQSIMSDNAHNKPKKDQSRDYMSADDQSLLPLQGPSMNSRRLGEVRELELSSKQNFSSVNHMMNNQEVEELPGIRKSRGLSFHEVLKLERLDSPSNLKNFCGQIKNKNREWEKEKVGKKQKLLGEDMSEYDPSWNQRSTNFTKIRPSKLIPF